MKPSQYWHFALDSRRTRYDDKPIVIGQTMKVSPPIEMCERGLHASKRAIDALQYAPGAYVCLVTLGGEVIHGNDKSVATERTVIAAADATELLFRFSMDVAARAMQAVGWEHEDSWNALSIREAHIQSLADDRDLSAAVVAAHAAAASAPGPAAWYAARYAARCAAESAAESAARYASRYAARYAAGGLPVELQAQNDELERRLLILLGVK